MNLLGNHIPPLAKCIALFDDRIAFRVRDFGGAGGLLDAPFTEQWHAVFAGDKFEESGPANRRKGN